MSHLTRQCFESGVLRSDAWKLMGLGLKVEERKYVLPVIVVDRAEKR